MSGNKLNIAISVWDTCVENVTLIENQLFEFNPIIINSTSKCNFKNQVNSKNIFLEQVNIAIKSSRSSENFIYISGDARMKNWRDLISRTQSIFQKYQPYVYSPYITFEGYPSETVKIKSVISDPDLEIGVMTDGIVFALNAEVAMFIESFTDYLLGNSAESYKIGWGLDWAWSIFSILNERVILRDNNLYIEHSQSTSYSSELARKELSLILKELPNFLENFGFSRIQVNRVLYAISERLKSNPKFSKFQSFYLNNPLGNKS